MVEDVYSHVCIINSSKIDLDFLDSESVDHTENNKYIHKQ